MFTHTLRKTVGVFFLVCAPVFWAPASIAEKLTVSMLERFAQTQVELETLSEKYESLSDSVHPDLLFKDEGQGILDQIKEVGAYGEAENIVKGHGFQSLPEFVALMSRLMSAQMAVEFERHGSEMLDSVANADIAEMRKSMLDAGLSETMVDAQLEKIEQSMALVKSTREASASAQPDDIAFVKANEALVQKAFDY